MCLSNRTPWFNNWGFNLSRGQALLDKWNQIPEGVDILMTHGPPLGKLPLSQPLYAHTPRPSYAHTPQPPWWLTAAWTPSRSASLFMTAKNKKKERKLRVILHSADKSTQGIFRQPLCLLLMQDYPFANALDSNVEAPLRMMETLNMVNARTNTIQPKFSL